MKIKDKHLVLNCAFRYALGRRTYVVSSVVSEILTNWDEFDDSTKDRFKREIREHKELYGSLGDACDENEWNKILNR